MTKEVAAKASPEIKLPIKIPSKSEENCIAKIIKIPAVDVVLAFILVFITAFLVVKIIQIIVGAIFSGEIMKSLDRVLGLAFGAIEGLLIVSCILILLKAQIWFDSDSLLSDSTLAKILLPYLSQPISYIRGMLA